MLDVFMSVMPLISGGLFGALLRLWSNSQQSKADYNKQVMEAMSRQNEQTNKLNSHASVNIGFAWTRRFIVLAVMSVVVGVFWTTSTVSVPVVITEGSSYLFGLIDTTISNTVYQQVEGGRVLIPEMVTSFQLIIGTYIGSSTVGRIR